MTTVSAPASRLDSPAPVTSAQVISPSVSPAASPHHSLANIEPLSEDASFRALWLAAGLTLVLLLRCQRRRA